VVHTGEVQGSIPCASTIKPAKHGLSPTAKLETAGINDAKACRGESRALNEQLILLRKG